MALANHAAGLGHDIVLWEFNPDDALKLSSTRKRESVLKNVILNEHIHVTSNLDEAVKDAHIILLVIPSHVFRNVVKQIAQCDILPESFIVSCTKGIENDSLMSMSEIIFQEMPGIDPDHVLVLSGPSHAEEVSRGVPTAVVVASKHEHMATTIQKALSNVSFRIYRSNDIIGVELGGSLKNVIAIAAGICDGAGFGDNTKAALQPRGLAEIIRLGRKLGAAPITFSGLSGMGDLIVTCMSMHSRNRYVGEQIGKGNTLESVLANMTMVAEGIRTCKSTYDLAQKYNVEMPICSEVYGILFENKEPIHAMTDLMNRDVKPEIWY